MLSNPYDPVPGEVISFVSGIHSPAQVKGFAMVNWHVGLTLPKVSKEMFKTLPLLLQSKSLLFLDTGVFSEARIGAQGTISYPKERAISPKEMERRLGIALEVGKTLGSHLFIVAPDRVGSAQDTLLRLNAHANTVRAIRDTGARILVVHQPGLAFDVTRQQATSILGFDDWIPAFPMRGRIDFNEILRYIETWHPAFVHFLGFSVEARVSTPFIQAVRAIDPRVVIMMDAVRIRALLGRTRDGIQPLTKWQDQVRDEMLEQIYQVIEGVDYTDTIFLEIDEWLVDPDERAKVAEDLCLEPGSAGYELFVRSPHDYLQWLSEEYEGWDDITHAVIDHAWKRYTIGELVEDEKGRKKWVGGRLTARSRQTEAIVRYVSSLKSRSAQKAFEFGGESA